MHDGKDLSWSSNFSSVASKQWNWAINSCLFEASQVTLGRQTAIKLGLGHPITFLHMSVKIEFAMEATKHIHIVLVAGPIHDGIFKLIPRQNCTDGLHWGYFCLFLCQNYKEKWEIWGKYLSSWTANMYSSDESEQMSFFKTSKFPLEKGTVQNCTQILFFCMKKADIYK